ncbi:H-NS histone family protein [Pandoraea communis]|uniref:H-NS histone family protein n=1 Tax=Pandoraea communis TaxID=2508297 RepID=UPI0025A65D49|nr:H-NS histone family protein [Pandoraea communis]MDM8356158.1 H-NS histone family protein [Pandoraea communis]
MATYLELKAKAEKLLQEAEQLRLKEVADVIADMKEKIAQYGITGADLGLVGATKKTSVKKSAGAVAPKYRGPNGEEWSGRGRQPQWLTAALEQGKTKEDFAI